MLRETSGLGVEMTSAERATTLAVLTATFLFVPAAPAVGQLRVVTYNTANADVVNPRADMNVVLDAIGNESVNDIARPIDVFVLQEQASSATTTQAIVGLLNDIYDADIYDRATLDGATWGAGRSGLVFNTQSVSLIEQHAFGQLSWQGQVRQTLRYKLRPVGYDSSAEFCVYSNHYKAGYEQQDQDRREVEATTLRANADALGQGAHIIYAGDYNIRSSDEASYQTLLAYGNGEAFDPINRPGVWHNSSLLRLTHTQAPANGDDVPPGLYGGGMDDRFDFQLVSNEMLDGEGLSYIPGSYHAFGNNGTHPCCNSSITDGSGAADSVLEALTRVSDHLPVVADYQVPAMMNVSVAELPDRVLVGAGVDLQVTVDNRAPVAASRGADELDYEVTGFDTVLGAASGTVAALSGGNTHALALDTSTAGIAIGSVRVLSTSQSVAGGDFLANVSATVLDHATASFQRDSLADELVLDFGNVPVGSGPWSLCAGLWNIESPSGFTAGLDLDRATGYGATAVLMTDLTPFSDLSADSERPFNVFLDTSTVGDFSATYGLDVSDEDLPGGLGGTSLLMVFSGSVYLPADIDGNGRVNGLDVDPFTDILLDGSYNPSADMNGDHVVNGLDVGLFAAAVVGVTSTGTAVPEPSTCGLLALAALTVAGYQLGLLINLGSHPK